MYSIYSSTKIAVVNYAQEITDEWADDGISVNVINPQRTMRRRTYWYAVDVLLSIDGNIPEQIHMANKPPKKITITPDGMKITQEEMIGSNI